MEVLWSLLAERDLDAIAEYIARDNLDAALALDEHIRNAADDLAMFPRKGKPGRVPGTRELVVHPSYIMVYTMENKAVHIIAMLHATMQWPRSDT